MKKLVILLNTSGIFIILSSVEIEDTGFPSDGLLKETYLEKMACLAKEKKRKENLQVLRQTMKTGGER